MHITEKIIVENLHTKLLKKRLSNIEVVMQNQDNREHDILDSDDYYQFQGGMTAAVNTVKGSQPENLFWRPFKT